MTIQTGGQNFICYEWKGVQGSSDKMITHC